MSCVHTMALQPEQQSDTLCLKKKTKKLFFYILNIMYVYDRETKIFKCKKKSNSPFRNSKINIQYFSIFPFSLFFCVFIASFTRFLCLLCSDMSISTGLYLAFSCYLERKHSPVLSYTYKHGSS